LLIELNQDIIVELLFCGLDFAFWLNLSLGTWSVALNKFAQNEFLDKATGRL